MGLSTCVSDMCIVYVYESSYVYIYNLVDGRRDYIQSPNRHTSMVLSSADTALEYKHQSANQVHRMKEGLKSYNSLCFSCILKISCAVASGVVM